MLVMRRKVGESIVMNDVIRVTIFAIEGDRVKIGIEAPPEVLIVRDELLRLDRRSPVLPSPAPDPHATE